MGRVLQFLRHGWNAFQDAPIDPGYSAPGSAFSYRQARAPMRYANDKSIIGSIYNRLALDVASVEFMHVRNDNKNIPQELIPGSLNECLMLTPNIDQSAQALKQDIAFTMFENGHCAVVPVDSNIDPSKSASYEFKSMRVGRVVTWHPRHVRVEIYDDREFNDRGEPVDGGKVKQLVMPKEVVAIVENPFYTVMNEPSGVLQRLLRKLALLDGIDEAAGSGKLDIIFQLPYTVRSESRAKQAESRRQALATQLKDDELGIGYIDVSEKVIQLNRPVDNKLLDQIETLTNALYTQLGITPEIMNGSADRDTINNYYDRTIEPICNAVALEMKRKFLTKTARTQGQSIEIYRDPLKMIPLSELAEVSDKLLRNAAVTSNELRPKIGYWPSDDPRANELANPNMPMEKQPQPEPVEEVDNVRELPRVVQES